MCIEKENKTKQNIQKSALASVEKCIGPKSVTLNLVLKKKKPIPGNSKQETPQVPSTKTRGKFHLFPQTLNIQQYCPRYTSPKLLYPQEVPSRIPAGLFGPLPPNLQSSIGQSSLTYQARRTGVSKWKK